MTEDINARLAVIENDVRHMRKGFDADRERINAHLESADDYRDRVVRLEIEQKSLGYNQGEHAKRDTSAITIMVALQLGQIALLGTWIVVN